MASHDTFGKKGTVLHRQAREIIANVLAFMKEEGEYFKENKATKIPITNYKQRAMASTGISKKMYDTILKESKNVRAGAATSFSTPRKKRSYKQAQELVECEKHAETIIDDYDLTNKQPSTIEAMSKPRPRVAHIEFCTNTSCMLFCKNQTNFAHHLMFAELRPLMSGNKFAVGVLHRREDMEISFNGSHSKPQPSMTTIFLEHPL